MMKICEAGRDSCGCNNWSKGIRTIDGQYPDDNRDFNLAAGDGIEITPVTAGVEISVKAPLPGPMIFRGTVGTGGTIASLPDANVDNIGWTYVALSAGTTPDDTPKSYDTGDTLVSNGEEWTVIPSGDDPVAWSQITGTPTTLAGYGITDAVSGTNAGTDTKPIKIVNGVATPVANDLVNVANNQTVGGTKTFSNKIIGQIEKADKIVSGDGTCEIGAGNNGSISIKDSSLSLMSSAIFMEETPTQGSTVLQTYLTGGNWTGLYVKLNTSNTATLQLIKIISGVASVTTITTL